MASYEEDDTESLLEYQESTRSPFSQETNRQAVLAFAVFLCFLASSGYTITLPSMYLFLQEMGECSYTAIIQGVAIGLYCLGQVLSSYLLGIASHRVPITLCILVSLGFDLGGNLLYGLSTNVYMLLPARFLAGIGAGNVAISRAYVSSIFPRAARPTAMGYLATAQAIGFIYGPAVGAVVSFVSFEVHGVAVNQFTLPAFLSAVLSIIGLVGLVLFFRKLPRQPQPPPEEQVFVAPVEKKKNRWGIIVLLISFFIVTLVFVLVETTLTPSTVRYFGWTARGNMVELECDNVKVYRNGDRDLNGVLFNGILFLTMGITAFVTLMVVANYKRIVSRIAPNSGFGLNKPSPWADRLVLTFGWLVMLGGALMLFSWTSPVALYRYIVGIELLGPIGYSIGQVTILTIYSKIVSGAPARLISWITTVGSLARILGPVISGVMFWYDELDLVAAVTFFVLCLNFALILISWFSLTSEIAPPLSSFSINNPSAPFDEGSDDDDD